MSDVSGQSLAYSFEGTRLLGHYSGPSVGSGKRPGVVIVHDAFGVGDAMKAKAEQLANIGYAALAADLWGDGKQLREEGEIGPMIGRFAGDRRTWMGRLKAAHETLAAQPGVDTDNIASIGYCFGGASVLEYARTTGGVKGVVSFHGGLNLVLPDWTGASTKGKVLILTGADDPMAASDTLLAVQNGMTAAGVDWETNIYGHTKHGFTNPNSDRANKPQVIAYSAQADKRSWAAMVRFLAEIFAA